MSTEKVNLNEMLIHKKIKPNRTVN